MALSGINKGKGGEREICKLLNGILIILLKEMGRPQEDIHKAVNSVQRNQNQSAVGGGDLTNTWGMCIEVKRQETLVLNTWWNQCVASAKRNNEWPVLIYRQNGKSWQVRTYAFMSLPDGTDCHVVAEISYLHFQNWYKLWVKKKLEAGETIRS